MEPLVKISIDDYNVALVQLDSPETRNALSQLMKEELIGALERADVDPGVHCIVLAGSEAVFAAGADIRELATRSPDSPGDEEQASFWRRLGEIETPTVAAVSGFALGGGCELALACDMIVASEGARFGLPEVTLGIIPGGGGTQRLTRVVGKQRAMEYVLTGRHFDAKMAVRWNLVNKTIPQKSWLVEAVELARTVAERAPLATKLGKRAVLEAEQKSLSEGIAAERELFDEAMATEDRVEGMKAFIEKREPNFRGK